MILVGSFIMFRDSHEQELHPFVVYALGKVHKDREAWKRNPSCLGLIADLVPD